MAIRPRDAADEESGGVPRTMAPSNIDEPSRAELLCECPSLPVLRIGGRRCEPGTQAWQSSRHLPLARLHGGG